MIFDASVFPEPDSPVQSIGKLKNEYVEYFLPEIIKQLFNEFSSNTRYAELTRAKRCAGRSDR